MTAERCNDDSDDVFVRGAIFLSYVLADERLELALQNVNEMMPIQTHTKTLEPRKRERKRRNCTYKTMLKGKRGLQLKK